MAARTNVLTCVVRYRTLIARFAVASYSTLILASLITVGCGKSSGSMAGAAGSAETTRSTPATPAPGWPPWPSETDIRAMGEGHTKNHPQVDAAHGIVAATSGETTAVKAGIEALKAGGTAADAAVATALAQVTLAAGSWTSFAGVMNGLYYEAKTGKVYALNGWWNVPKGEPNGTDIPRGSVVRAPPTGRTAMVPGWFSGMQALHHRFGKLPWKQLFGPAIGIADSGYVLDAYLASEMADWAPLLRRLPETRAVFFRPDGSMYKRGELFKQPALANTLRHVAQEGSAYMYEGPWAQHFVSAVQHEGGRITMEDMAAYQATWSTPIHADHRGYTVYATPRPNQGGISTLAALNLVEAAGIPAVGHPSTSPEALFRFIQAVRAPSALNFGAIMNPNAPMPSIPNVDLSDAGLLNKSNMQKLWKWLNTPAGAALLHGAKPVQEHSDAIIVIDSEGNIVALTQTCNAMMWGTTAIFVDGVSVPDAAAFQQAAIKAVGPGNRLTDPTNPLIVLKDGKPILGGSSIGGGLYQATIQSLVNILDYGMAPQIAIDTSQFIGPGPSFSEAVMEGTFPDSVLAGVRARGQALDVHPWPLWQARGFWVVATTDAATHTLRGGASVLFNGNTDGYGNGHVAGY